MGIRYVRRLLVSLNPSRAFLGGVLSVVLALRV